jgi:uncharacterized protein (TIGR02118 family)
MIKLIACFKRRPDISPEAFQQHWSTTHADLVVRSRGLRRYIQNHTLLSVYARREPVFDGVAEVWFEDDALGGLQSSPELAAVRADEADFIDAPSLVSFLVDEHVIVDGPEPADGVKQISFLRAKPGLGNEAFRKHWRELHGPIAAGVPGMRRYVQNHTRTGARAAGFVTPYDGVPIAWFDDTATMRASADSDAYKRTRADEANFLSSDPLPFVLSRARVIRY